LDLAQAQLDSMWLGLSAAMMAGDTSRLSAFYADSALFAETGTATLVGLARIQVRPEITELWGRRAFQFGTYRDVIEPAGQAAITFHGRFAAIIDRGSTSAWYITRLIVIRDSSVPPLSVR
jgi:hypothetical protein